MNPLLLSAVVLSAAALAVFVAFLLVRAIAEAVWRWLRRKKDPLVVDQLADHLAALEAPRTLGDRLDRGFQRLVGRSSLELSVAQASGYLLLVAALVGGGVYLWREDVGWAAAAGFASMAPVLVYFLVMHRVWRGQVQEQLPDTLHLLARSLRAGLTVDQAVALIAVRGQQPLAAEFKRCAEHLQLGLTVPAAFRMTAGRLGLADFDLLVSLVVLHRQTGGNLALLVDRLATTVRSRNQFRGQVAAVTALGRLSGFALAAAAPTFAVLYYFMYPDYLTRMLETPQGTSALLVSATLEVVGVAWLLWLLRVDY